MKCDSAMRRVKIVALFDSQFTSASSYLKIIDIQIYTVVKKVVDVKQRLTMV